MKNLFEGELKMHKRVRIAIVLTVLLSVGLFLLLQGISPAGGSAWAAPQQDPLRQTVPTGVE